MEYFLQHDDALIGKSNASLPGAHAQRTGGARRGDSDDGRVCARAGHHRQPRRRTARQWKQETDADYHLPHW